MRIKSVYLVLAIGLVVCAIAVSIYLHGQETPVLSMKPISQHGKGQHGHCLAIEGFRYQEVQGSGDGLSIQADSFIIEKKKIGFFRFGLAKVARLRNAVFEFHGMRGAREIYNTHYDRSSEPLDKEIYSSFTDVFQRGDMKRAFSIIIDPVCVRYFEDDILQSEIRAGKARIGSKENRILLENNVAVQSGSKKLLVEKAILFYNQLKIAIDCPYVLYDGDARKEGRCLTTDIWLGNGT